MKETYTVNQVEDAIKALVRHRLVDGWSGCLKLEYNLKTKKLSFGQYPSSSTWTEGFETVYRIDDREDWNDFLFDCGVHGNSDELRLDASQWEGYEVLKTAKIDDDEYVLTGEQIADFFDELDWDNILEYQYEQARNYLFELGAEDVEEEVADASADADTDTDADSGEYTVVNRPCPNCGSNKETYYVPVCDRNPRGLDSQTPEEHGNIQQDGTVLCEDGYCNPREITMKEFSKINREGSVPQDVITRCHECGTIKDE